MPGSPQLVRSLLRDSLLDEISLDIMPTVVGTGARLFDGIADQPFEVIESVTLGNGVLQVRYRPDQT